MNCQSALAKQHNLIESYETDQVITWCGGCGNYGIQNALMRALTLEDLSQNDVILCYDVGCSGNGSDKIHANTIHGLHGRVLPLAGGVSLAQYNKKVIASAGDGATFSEGVGHVVHAVRSNYPVVFLHHNNENYALTTGQASSLTPCGHKRSAAKDGPWTPPLNYLQMLLALQPSFVARSFSGDVDHLTSIIQQGLRQNGFAFIDILQTCPTYNRESTNKWYLDRIYDVKQDPSYDKTNINHARKIADLPWEEKIAIGVLHEAKRANYYEQMNWLKEKKTNLCDEIKNYDVSSHLDALVIS